MELTKNEMQTILNKFTQEYAFAYETEERGQAVCGSEEAVTFFNYFYTRKIEFNANFVDCINQLAKYRQDAFSSDRECASIVFALDSLGYLDKWGM